MKKSYKIMALLLVAIMCVGCFTGCGKTEEEKAMEEMAEQFQEGLKQDEALKEEIKDITSNLANKDALLKEMQAEDFPALKEAYKNYKEATENISALAKEYNKLFDECVEKRVKQGLKEEDIVDGIAAVTLRRGRIPVWTIDGLEVFEKNYKNMNYEKVSFSWNKETDNFVYYFSDSNFLKGTVLKKDSSICEVSFEGIENVSSVKLDSFNDKEMIFSAYVNGKNQYYKFDISKDKAVIVEIVDDLQVVDGYEKIICGNDLERFATSLIVLK